MTTKNDMINRIEDMLGSEGSRHLAEQMFDALADRVAVVFDPQVGYQFCSDKNEYGQRPEFDRLWDAALDSVLTDAC